MKKLSGVIIFIFVVVDIYLLGKILLTGKNVQILNPQGLIAMQERQLIFIALSLMLLGAIPVLLFAFYVGRKYRKGSNASYHPEWDHNTGLQIFFWAFLSSIIIALSTVVWISAHKLDPHIAIVSNKKPFVIQVIALQWKWLFLYPQQGIATVNYIEFPEKTPVTFEITASDSPMNSFWIPQLGGQIYAMSGMATQTYLIADGVGQYRGSTAEISGAGFSQMVFTARSVTNNDFTSWVSRVKQSPNTLTVETFKKLDRPSESYPVTFYSSTPDNLFTTIVMQYMAKSSPKVGQTQQSDSMGKMQGM